MSDAHLPIDGNDLYLPPDAASSRQSRCLDLNEALADLPPVERLRLLRKQVKGKLVLTTSFGLEDQALTHMVVAAGIEVHLATLDTGRLFPEVHAVWAETETRYGVSIESCCPDAQSVRAFVAEHGINGFYTSMAARKACCGIRKLVPLRMALHGAAGWVTGVRADQTDTRRSMNFASYDTDYRLVKANPLLDWSREQTLAFIQAEKIPTNPLHERGFLSIGCAPCTRPVAPGEPERAGRWWWETEGTTECGLHVAEDGRLIRAQVPE